MANPRAPTIGETLENVRLLSHRAKIGDTRSLILHPASTTHRHLTEEQVLAAGAGPDIVRCRSGSGPPTM